MMIADAGCILARTQTRRKNKYESVACQPPQTGYKREATPTGWLLFEIQNRDGRLQPQARFRPILLLLLRPLRQARWGRVRRLPTACRNHRIRPDRLYRCLRLPAPRRRIRGTFLLAFFYSSVIGAKLPRPRTGYRNLKYLNQNRADLQELCRLSRLLNR